jgi:hypothetical protein
MKIPYLASIFIPMHRIAGIPKSKGQDLDGVSMAR